MAYDDYENDPYQEELERKRQEDDAIRRDAAEDAARPATTDVAPLPPLAAGESYTTGPGMTLTEIERRGRANAERNRAAYLAAPTAPTAPPAPPAAPRKAGKAPPGFDQKKWVNEKLGTSHKYVGGRHLSGGGTIDSLLALPEFKGWVKLSEDKVRGPDGGVYDVYRDYNGARQVQWTKITGGYGGDGVPGTQAGSQRNAVLSQLNSGPSTMGQGQINPGGVSGNPLMSAGGPIAPAPMLAGEMAMRNALQTLMGKNLQDYDPTKDPNMQVRVDAYRNEQERGARRARAEEAERAAQMGLNLGGQGSGSFESIRRGIGEKAGVNTSNYAASQIQDELKERRQQLMQAIQVSNSVGARDQESALRQQLAQLEASLRKSQLSQQGSQWNDQYGLSLAELQYRMDRDAMLAGLGGGTSGTF